MLKINLTQGLLAIDNVSVIFPIDIDALIGLLGICRAQKAKFNHIFIWDDQGIIAFSKNGEVAESLLVSIKDQELGFSPQRMFEGEFMFEGVEILSYRAANKDKLIKLFSADEGKAFVSGDVSVWFDVKDDVIEAMEISAYKPKEIPKPLGVDTTYAYLEPLWQEWIEEVTKAVPTNNRYYNLTYGLTEEDVKKGSRLRKGIDIPAELVNFYKIRNVEYDGVASAFGFSTHYYQYDLIPFENIVSEWENIQNLQFGDALGESNLEGYSPKIKADDYANPKWVPFAEGRNGDYLLYDTDPGEAGKYGQIIELQNESWERNVVADSLSELLRKEIDALKNGEYQKFNFILDKQEAMQQANCKWTTFKEVKHLFPQKTWAYWRNEVNKGELEDEIILLVEGDIDMDNFDLDAPITSFKDRFDDYETYLKQESCFTILIQGSLKAKNIFNEEADGSTGLVVLGNIEADNIVVGGQEMYITGGLKVTGLFWGDYNHGELKVEGNISSRVFLATDQYSYPTDMNKENIGVFLDDEQDEDVSPDDAERYFHGEYLDLDVDIDECYGWGSLVSRYDVLEALKEGKGVLKESFAEEKNIDIPKIFDDIRMDSDEDLFAESKNFDTLFEKVVLSTKEETQVLEENGWKTNFHTTYDSIGWIITATRDDGLALSILNTQMENKKQLVIYFVPPGEKKAKGLFHNKLSEKFLPDIKKYWSNLLASAEKGIYFKNLLQETIKPQDIVDITSLPLISEKYDDWNSDDRHGDWFGNRMYSFCMNGFSDTAATLRIGAEIKSDDEDDEFDMRFYYFENDGIQNPKGVLLMYRSSQENRTGDYYSETHLQVCTADWKKYQEALAWYTSTIPKIEKANTEFLEEKEANSLHKEQIPKLAAKAKKPFENIKIGGVNFKVINRNEAEELLKEVTDFDDTPIYDVYEMFSTDGDDESLQNSFFLLCEDEVTLEHLYLDTGVEGTDTDDFYILGYIFAQKVKIERYLEAYDLDFSPPIICLKDAEITNAILCGTTHYFGANLNIGTFWGEYNHGEAYIKGEIRAKLIIADDFGLHIGKIKDVLAMVCDEMRVYAHDTIAYEDGTKEILNEQWATYNLEECVLPQFIYKGEYGYAIKDTGYRSGENHYKEGEVSFDEFLHQGGNPVDHEKIERLKTEFIQGFEEKTRAIFATHPTLRSLSVGQWHRIDKYEDYLQRYYYFMRGDNFFQVGYWGIESNMVAFGYVVTGDTSKTVLEYFDEGNKVRKYAFQTNVDMSGEYISSLACQRVFREAIQRLEYLPTEEEE